MLPDQVPLPGPSVQGNSPNGGTSTTCAGCGVFLTPSMVAIMSDKGPYCCMGCASATPESIDHIQPRAGGKD